ncbi:uncharacterized protein RCC_08804 [Ramularia collo-cygni]|uniref:Uncharacterized protein n=1 Tax=Ramularia collo-cygni TaxID=112498 RepID=A0A2D3VKX1_9PEZI|nr:uncharacterized protein RCC_08804 [Ramularia collo-cygni]CZT23094.1 uncharacterized protein RCC_08804 [Ramularia collo-cygni]
MDAHNTEAKTSSPTQADLADIKIKEKEKDCATSVRRTRERLLKLPAELQELIVIQLIATFSPHTFGFCNDAELSAMATVVLKMLLNARPKPNSSGYTLEGGSKALWDLAPIVKVAIVKNMPALARAVPATGPRPVMNPIAINLSPGLCKHLQSLHLTILEHASGNASPFMDAHASMKNLEAWLPQLKTLKVDVVNVPVMHHGAVVRLSKTHANDIVYAHLINFMRTLTVEERYICFDTKHGDYTIQASATMNGRVRERHGVAAYIPSAQIVARLHASPRCEFLLLRAVLMIQDPLVAAKKSAWMNVV